MRRPRPVLRYWDSCVFLAYLKKERERVDQCQAILNEAQSGRTKIITSAATLFEVLFLDPHQKYNEESQRKIRDLFNFSFIHIINLTRYVSEEAQNLKWKHRNIDIKDAGHLATVIDSEISLLETYDNTLIKYDREFENQINQKIKIAEPSIGQIPIPFEYTEHKNH